MSHHFCACITNRCNTKLLWDLWWGGNALEHYAPYKQLRGFDLQGKKECVLLSKAKTVMLKVLESHPQQVLTPAAITALSVNNRDHYFALAFVDLFQKLSTEGGVEMFDSHRVGEISYTTVYDVIKIAFPTVRV